MMLQPILNYARELSDEEYVRRNAFGKERWKYNPCPNGVPIYNFVTDTADIVQRYCYVPFTNHRKALTSQNPFDAQNNYILSQMSNEERWIVFENRMRRIKELNAPKVKKAKANIASRVDYAIEKLREAA